MVWPRVGGCRSSVPRLLFTLLVEVGCACSAGALARGQALPVAMPTGDDYDVLNSEWNGLSELARMLAEEGYSVSFDEPLSMDRLGPETPVALIYPRIGDGEGELPVDDLLAFVSQGGRLLIADDFGEGGLITSAVGVVPRWGALPHRQFFRGNPDLPAFWPTRGGELLDGVVRIVANHPVAFESPAPPVIAYDEPGYGLLFDVGLGEGRLLILGDPSLFINFMLDVADSRVLVRNLFAALCRDLDPCDLQIVTRRGRFLGQVRDHGEAGEEHPLDVEHWIGQSASRINTRLGELKSYRPRPSGLLFISIVLVAGLCAFIFTLLPLRRPRWLDFNLSGTPSGLAEGSRDPARGGASSRARGLSSADLAVPLAILKEEFEDLFYSEYARDRALPERPIQRDLAHLKQYAAWAAERMARDLSTSRRRRVYASALKTLKALEKAVGWDIIVEPVTGRRRLARQFLRLVSDTEQLLMGLGLWEEYEDRFGKPKAD